MPTLPSPGAGPLEPKTPREARGLIRKVSRVQLNYPLDLLLGGLCASGPSRPAKPPKRLAQAISDEDAARRRAALAKKVSFADDSDSRRAGKAHTTLASTASPEGETTQALQRSAKKMDALYDLRRTGKEPSPDKFTPEDADAGEEAPVASGPTFADEGDDALMTGVLRELNDTEAQLRQLEDSMAACLKEASENGGARHATAVVSERVLAVARRKADLLRDVEARVAALLVVHENREQLLPKIIADEEQPPAEIGGLRKFIAAYTHSGGGPADENKSHFKRFAKSFRLPRQHDALNALRALAEEVADFWASACLSEAEKGHGHVVLRRLFDIAVGTGVDEDHPKLLRAIKILNDRLATRVLQEAEERRQQDAKEVDRGKTPKVGCAAGLADKIEADVVAAIKEGVPELDARLMQAKEICKALRQKDGERKRMEGRQKRLEANGAAAK